VMRTSPCTWRSATERTLRDVPAQHAR
jgi:hypothetical protein